ncbi:hypothetical protein AUC43_11490 [Hymenobacter sedentarius]|uniref:Uncharacterized protein n=1 Tax=Hymenobacter sedentarius TaxID=1411621 RepID=A0A0U4CBZ8_9BACT|nr:hypothetical protein [Hymenobacter sedentarius]ALW85657.1 hypothetical protein AUC43_11490 [Hymenobacter sedentarius]
MPTLTEQLANFKQAQHALYTHLGVSRRNAKGQHISVPQLRYTHGSGNQDIPTAYPEVLDYRGKEWRASETAGNSDEEIHIMIDSSQDWTPNNTIRFSILSIWDTEEEGGTVFVAANHLLKADEMHYEHSDSVESVEAGTNFYGDTCLLILNPRLGESLLEDYHEYTRK